MGTVTTYNLFENRTTTGYSAKATNTNDTHRTYQFQVEGTGAVTAAGEVQVSNKDIPDEANDRDWEVLSTFSLTGTDEASTGANSTAVWKHTRVKLNSITGTGAAFRATMVA